MALKIMRFGVGIDVSMKNFHACIAAETSGGIVKVLATRNFRNTKAGFKSVIDWISKHKKEKDLPLRVLMEVTGVYHENVLHHLHEQGFEVVLEQGKKVKRYFEMLGQYSKTDKLDGKGMAHMACKNYGKVWKPISKHILEIRAALRHRKSLIANKNRLTNQLHAMKHSKYPVKEVVKSLGKLIKVISKEIDSIENNANKMAELDVELLEKVRMIADSVKGLGILTVLTIVAETNGFHDFSSSKQLVSYSGYDIIENQSGTFEGKTRMSKRGNANIRANLYMASVGVVGKKLLPFYNLYLRLLNRNGFIKKKAMVAVQRKLLVLIYTLWKKNEAFDISYYKQVEIASV